jgi:hypothetical protein
LRLVFPALALLFVAAGLAPPKKVQDGPIPLPVEGFKALEPGEHPRLFFRKADLPELRKRAETPEGKAVSDDTLTLGGRTVRFDGEKIDFGE